MHGWTRTPVDIALVVRAARRPGERRPHRVQPDVAEAILAEHPGTEVDYAVNLWSRGF